MRKKHKKYIFYILSIIIPIFLSFNKNLNNKNIVFEDDSFITILLTLFGFSITMVSIFYGFLTLNLSSKDNIDIETKELIKSKMLSSIKHLKQDLLVQFTSLSFIILISLMKGIDFFYILLEKFNSSIYNFIISHQFQIIYFFKICVLCSSMLVVLDIILGIFTILKIIYENLLD